MNSPVSLVAGGTGLVGSYIISSLSKRLGKQIIVALSFDSEIPENAEVKLINFDDLNSNKVDFNNHIDHIYLCLGKKLHL